MKAIKMDPRKIHQNLAENCIRNARACRDMYVDVYQSQQRKRSVRILVCINANIQLPKTEPNKIHK